MDQLTLIQVTRNPMGSVHLSVDGHPNANDTGVNNTFFCILQL